MEQSFYECISWIFDGIGSTIVGVIVSFIVGVSGGGVAGYRIGRKKAVIKQVQKSEDFGRQIQIGIQHK